MSVLHRSIELLEPYDGKLSCTVLRGESTRKGADLPDPALDNDISSFLNAIGSDLRHFRLDFSNPYRTDFVNPIQPEYVPNTSYAREYAVSIVANLTKESIKNPDFWSRSATDVLTACIWYLREEHPEICDIPHVLAMVGSNGTALLNTLQKNIITEQWYAAFTMRCRGVRTTKFPGYLVRCRVRLPKSTRPK